MKKRTTFVCSECGDECEVVDLSRSSLKAAGTTSKIEALESLTPWEIVCAQCDNYDPELEYIDRGRSPAERFEFEGAYIDQAAWQAHCLNY